MILLLNIFVQMKPENSIEFSPFTGINRGFFGGVSIRRIGSTREK